MRGGPGASEENTYDIVVGIVDCRLSSFWDDFQEILGSLWAVFLSDWVSKREFPENVIGCRITSAIRAQTSDSASFL